MRLSEFFITPTLGAMHSRAILEAERELFRAQGALEEWQHHVAMLRARLERLTGVAPCAK